MLFFAVGILFPVFLKCVGGGLKSGAEKGIGPKSPGLFVFQRVFQIRIFSFKWCHDIVHYGSAFHYENYGRGINVSP